MRMRMHVHVKYIIKLASKHETNEPPYEKTNISHNTKRKAQISCEADQRFCFRYTDSAITLLSCTDRFVSNPFGNHLQRLVFS